MRRSGSRGPRPRPAPLARTRARFEGADLQDPLGPMGLPVLQQIGAANKNDLKKLWFDRFGPCGAGVLIELVQAPPEVIAAFAQLAG